MRKRPLLAIAVIIAVATSLPALGGCASTRQASAPGSTGPTDPNAIDPAQQGGSGITVGQRAQSALEGLLMGAVIGAQAGPIGMAAGAGLMLIYSAITGRVPLGGGARGPMGGGALDPYGNEAQREAQLEHEIEQEMQRADALEAQIEEELKRQEELLHDIDRQDTVARSASTPAPAPSKQALSERADPRAAPITPQDRDLPAAIFTEETVTVRKRAWGDNKKMQVVRRTLDADRDGHPEEVRYFDEKSGVMIRKEEDRDYDGSIDAWSSYQKGSLSERVLDSDGDGKPDTWERYANGRMTDRTIDRNSDGVKDAFYTFQGDSLAEERHDADGDGKADLRVVYKDRKRVGTQEDRDQNGKMDTWTTYQTVKGEEIPVRIERDTTGNGEPDVFESFSVVHGKPVLAKREEDKNGDGKIDVTSIYEGGKLVRREISDPNLVPL